MATGVHVSRSSMADGPEDVGFSGNGGRIMWNIMIDNGPLINLFIYLFIYFLWQYNFWVEFISTLFCYHDIFV